MELGERLSDAAEGLLASLWTQFGGTFLGFGSTFSVLALTGSLMIFVLLVVGRRRRPVRLAVLRRILIPRRLFGTASGRTDAIYFAAGVLFAGVAIGWALVSADAVREAVLPALGPSPVPWLPAWASTGIATIALFLAYEFAYWLDHCLKHKVAFFWHFHKVHHQAESLSLFTNGRIHPVDTIVFANIVALFAGVTQALLVKLLGATATPLAFGATNLLVMVTAVTLTHLQHSHLWVSARGRWSHWILGPAHHQIHHSRASEHYDRNLGNALAIFDRLFGTFCQPDAKRPVGLRFGVADGEPAPHGWRAATVQPFIDAAGELLPPHARHDERPARPAAIESR